MTVFQDLIGKKINRLLVKSYLGSDDRKRPDHWYECVCDCGNKKKIRRRVLQSGIQISCGCLVGKNKKKFNYGKAHPREYSSWSSMRHRCDPDYRAAKNYAARGITICERWKDFRNFLLDMGSRPKGTTLDRINVNGNYEPDNCRWADAKTQQRNKRNTRKYLLNGELLTGGELAERYGIPRTLIEKRIYSGWTLEQAINSSLRVRVKPYPRPGFKGSGEVCRRGHLVKGNNRAKTKIKAGIQYYQCLKCKLKANATRIARLRAEKIACVRPMKNNEGK